MGNYGLRNAGKDGNDMTQPKSIYLDNAALRKPNDIALNYVINILNNQWYNPNSIYECGINSKQIINSTRHVISKEINCDPEEIIFCSCGSEANALANVGYIRANNQENFITSTIEHASISENPYARKIVTVDKNGYFDMNIIETIHDSLVSLQMANSEIGTIQDIKDIIRILHSNNCIVHTDAVAAFGKIEIDVKELDIDMMTATGQKIGSILGGAFLYKKKGIKLEPIIYGHNTLRGGTPNVASIASLGEVIKSLDYSSISSANRDYVCDYIVKNINDSYLVGASIESGNRLPHNLYMCFKGIEGESLLILLDMNGIQVSTGSACTSGSISPSATLSAIGIDEQDIHSCIRLTFSGKETQEELEYVCKTLKQCVESLRNFSTQ